MEPSPQSTSLPGNGDAASAFDTSTGESMMQTNVAGNTESARLDANSNTIMNIAPATAHGQSLQPNAFLNTNNEQLQYLNTQTINNSSPQTLDGGHLRASQTGDGFASPIQINLNSNNMDVGSSKDMAVNMNMDSMTNGDVNAGVNLGNNANANTGLLNEGQPRADNLKSSHEYTNTDAGVGSASGDANLYGLEKTQVDEQKELTRLLALMDDYTPTIPDAVTNYYLRSAGFDCPDEKVIRVVSMAAQKFIGELVSEALQKQKINRLSAQSKSKKPLEKKHVLTMEDLSYVLAHQGIIVKKPLYFT